MGTSDSARVGAVSKLCWLLAALSAIAALAGILTEGGGGRRVVETVRRHRRPGGVRRGGSAVAQGAQRLSDHRRGPGPQCLHRSAVLGAGLAQLVADVSLTPAEIVAKMLSFAALPFVAGGLLATLYRSNRTQESTQANQVGTPAER